jgi:hypothetical protein
VKEKGEKSMRVPLVGIASTVCAAVGLFGLFWYSELSDSERAQADEYSAEYARQLYHKGMGQLTSQELSHVKDLVKAHFAA